MSDYDIYEKYRNNYLRLIKQFCLGNYNLEKYKVFELLYSLELGMILWEDLPPDFDVKFKVPHRIDYGIDLVTLPYDKSCQVKLYHENSRITWSDISNYYTYSKGILNIDEMVLATTPEAKLDKMGEKLIIGNNIQLIRQDFKTLLGKYTPETTTFDVVTGHPELHELELRPYLLEATQIFNESGENTLSFQLPCGTGKSYIMLHIIREYLKIDPVSRHIIFCPWVDLAKQMYGLFVRHNINTDFIGDSHHMLTETSNVYYLYKWEHRSYSRRSTYYL